MYIWQRNTVILVSMNVETRGERLIAMGDIFFMYQLE